MSRILQCRHRADLANLAAGLLLWASTATLCPAQSVNLDAGFDWSMPDRFTDRNGDGRPDVPNSQQYVQNTGADCRASTIDKPLFVVDFRASSSTATIQPGGPPAAGNLPRPVRISEFDWRIAARDGGAAGVEVVTTRGPVLQRCLAEGIYDVTLTVRVPPVLGAPSSASTTNTVTVEDILIVSIGDSYASGEGNPERVVVQYLDAGRRRVTTAYWADPGTEKLEGFNRVERVLDQTATQGFSGSSGGEAAGGFSGASGGAAPGDFSGSAAQGGPFSAETGAATSFGPVAVPDRYSSHADSVEGWRHLMAHRSTLSAHAQVAMAIERADPRTSVTFVFLAASGATVGRGVTARYNGVANEPAVQGREPLPAQILQAKELVRNRKIDALLVSVGGNDIGFSNLVKALILQDTSDTRRGILNSVKDGDWTRLTDGLKGMVQWLDTNVGIDYLADEYRKLAYALSTELRNVEKVYITGYPDPTRSSIAQYCSHILDQAVEPSFGRHVLERAGFSQLQITREELKWADENVLQPLNAAVKAAADAHGWIYVDTYAPSRGHGLCRPSPYTLSTPLGNLSVEVAAVGAAIYPGNPYPNEVPISPARWFRRANESALLQGPHSTEDTKGTLHMNEFGHRMVRDQILRALRLPLSIPGVGPGSIQ